MITGRGVSSETASVLVTFGRRGYSTIVLTSSWTTWSCSRWCRWYTSVTKNTFQTVFLNKSRTNASVMERPCTFLCVRIGSKTYVTNCNRENITGSCSCSAVDHKSIVVRAIPYRSTKHDDHEGRVYALKPQVVSDLLQSSWRGTYNKLNGSISRYATNHSLGGLVSSGDEGGN